MHFPLYIVKKLLSNRQKSFSSFIIKVALVAVSLSICIILLSISITRAYQKEIRDKFYACWGHIHITQFLADPSDLLNDEKISYDSSLVQAIQHTDGIQSIYPYTIQSCLIKTKEAFDGVVFKAYPNESAMHRMKSFLKEGTLPSYSDTSMSDEIVISSFLAKKLNLNLNQKCYLYFVQKNEVQPKVRRVFIKGIYDTGLEEFDKLVLLGDAKFLTQLNQEDNNQIQGYEITVNNKNKINTMVETIYDSYIEPPLQVYSIQDRFSNIFSWLNMMNMNERIILFIMMIIALVNMITATLVLILERTNMIGVLKTMGSKSMDIQFVFLYLSMYIVFWGIVIGTSIAFLLIFLQQKFKFIHLDESTYFLKYLPVSFEWIPFILVLIATCIIHFLLLLIPSFIIKKIDPVKAIQYT
ncbi:MAG: FtsX-like permease family protein [Chitinophagaceae bacterium]